MMSKPRSPGVTSPPKPPKLTLPKPLHPKPPRMKAAKLAAPHPPARPLTPKPPRMEFPKPHTSDSLTTIPRLAQTVMGPEKPAFSHELKAVAQAEPAIKTVLWISAYPALLETATLMAQAEGFDVHTASNFKQVEAACHEDRFQLAVVDHTLAPKIKRAIAAIIRDKRRGTFILELCQVSSEIPDADYLLIGSEPAALVATIKRIARTRRMIR